MRAIARGQSYTPINLPPGLATRVDGRVVIWGSSHFPASTQRLTRELQLLEGAFRSLPPGFRADFRDVAARPEWVRLFFFFFFFFFVGLILDLVYIRIVPVLSCTAVLIFE